MNDNTRRPSLAELAELAAQAEETGKFHADYAIEGESMGPEALARIQKAAMAGHESSQEAITALQESRIMTFRDPFARAAYFRGRLEAHAKEEQPDPDKVLSTIFSAQAKTMFVKGDRGMERQRAIPLFTAHEDRRQAAKALGGDILPLRFPNSERKEQGTPREHITGESFMFLAPTTVADREPYEVLRQLLARMPVVLVQHFEGQARFDVRQAVWLALHLFFGARVFHPGAVRRNFEQTGGKLQQKHGTYVGYCLSSHEHLVLEDTPAAARFVELLQAQKPEYNYTARPHPAPASKPESVLVATTEAPQTEDTESGGMFSGLKQKLFGKD
jgi:hypothetical protein